MKPQSELIDSLVEAREYLLDAGEALEEAAQQAVDLDQETRIQDIDTVMAGALERMSVLLAELGHVDDDLSRQVKFPLLVDWESADEDDQEI